MEQGYSCCACQINPPQVTRRECGCTCQHNGETPPEIEWRSPKRRRPDAPNLQVSHVVTSMVLHGAATPTGYPQMGNYANVNANNLPRTSRVDPSGDQPASQNYLPVHDTYTSQHGLSRSRGGELASTITYVATSSTLSPRSQETPLSGDQRRSTSPGQELGTENSLAGLNTFDFTFNFNREPSWNGSNNNLLPFGSTGRRLTRFC
jgi:hypothetical protein